MTTARRVLAIAAVLTLLSPSSPAAARAGSVPTRECAFVPSPAGDSSSSPAAPRGYPTPFAPPAGTAAWTSPDGIGGRGYLLAPAAGTCVGEAHENDAYRQTVTLPGEGRPAYEQIFGSSDAGGEIFESCRFLPKVRAMPEATPAESCAPADATVDVIDTGVRELHAAIVRVAPGVTDPQLATSGGAGGTLAVVLGYQVSIDDYTFVASPYADCRVSVTTAGLCVASLQLFVTQAIRRQERFGRTIPETAAVRLRDAISRDGLEAGNIKLAVRPDAATQTAGSSTPNTRFTVDLTGICTDFTRPTWTVRDLAAPLLTVVGRNPNQFFAGRTGAAEVEARCGAEVVATAPIDVKAMPYVALGDSFASGEGADEADFQPGTTGVEKGNRNHGQSTGCHRATSSWPMLVAADTEHGLGANPISLVACSGAVARYLYQPNDTYQTAIGEYEPPQLYAVDPAGTTRATLSIGGNDVGFAKIVSGCVKKTPLVIGSVLGTLTDPNCRDPQGSTHRLAEGGLTSLTEGITVGAEKKTLADIYTDIASRLAPGGVLMVTEYPQLFSTSDSAYREVPKILNAWPACGLGTGGQYLLSRADAYWINTLATRGNEIIDRQVQAARERIDAQNRGVRIAAVSYDKLFENHRLCDADPYLNGIRVNYAPIGELTKPGPYQTSVHPNAEGQRQIAGAVARSMQIVLTLVPSAADQGASFTAAVAGFIPGEKVTAELHSTPVRLGTFTADGNGTVQTELKIPDSSSTGSHRLVFAGADSHQTLSYPITVQPKNHRSWLFAGGAVLLVLVLAGSGLLWRAARRGR